MTTRFQGKVVLVTGASRGLGAQLARRFAAEGATVALHCRVQRKKADRIAAEIDGTVHQADLGDLPALEALVAGVLKTHGRIDVLINNAGLLRSQFFALEDPIAWAEVVQINLVGTAQLTRSVVRSMIASTGGTIVNIASLAAVKASPGQSAYAAAKGGMVALTRSLGHELASRGVRVNAVVPGVLDVGMAARMPHEAKARWVEAIPVGRVGTADEVAEAVLFLASDQSRYIVGQSLIVDGGLGL